MLGPDLPEVPQTLKNIQHYLRIASMHDQRDPLVSYWCRLYALQTGLKLSTKTPKERNFLMKLMDWLEITKKELHDNEAISNDIAAQAHLENWALKLFLNADKNDRAGNFGKNVIQSFFTAGLLYDVLTVFGELSEEAAQNRKYAKWKAAYIYNCLKNKETPMPGPVQEPNECDELGNNMEEESDSTDATATVESNGKEILTNNRAKWKRSSNSQVNILATDPIDTTDRITTNNENIGEWTVNSKDCDTIVKTEGGIELSVEQVGKAQKFIKWAGSALNYDDVPTAVLNLRKALHLLTSGEELLLPA